MSESAPLQLTKAQLAFLRFHAETPAPHAWEWLDDQGRRSRGPHDAAMLRADRRTAEGRLTSLRIDAAELEALRPCWGAEGPFLSLSPVGRQALKRSRR